MSTANMSNFISEGYKAQQVEMHARPEGYGGSGWKYKSLVEPLIRQHKPKTVLDYGCGEGTLKKAFKKKFKILEYDPAIEGKDAMPAPADLVVCTDVLEHIELPYLPNVISHIFSLTNRIAFLAIATRQANKVLPDGRNAHLIIMEGDWWLDTLKKWQWKVKLIENHPKRLICVCHKTKPYAS